jgi:multiple sugar transport system permease protein
MVAPWLLHLLVFVAFPLGFACYLVFNEWHVVQGTFTFVGLKNVMRFLDDPDLGQAAITTVALMISQVLIVTMLSLALAILLNTRLRGTTFARTIFFLPIITSTVVIALVWRYLLAADIGYVNYFLSFFGVPGPTWLLDPQLSRISLLAMLVWVTTPYNILIFLAGLQAIPRELLDAALIDGAGAWKRFTSVTLPLLNPTLVLVLLLTTIGGLQVFAEPLVLTQGGPAGATTTVAVYLYEQGVLARRYGYAALIGLALGVSIFVLVMIQRRLVERRIDY